MRTKRRRHRAGNVGGNQLNSTTASTTIIDLIWNISLVCPWDCHFCCTDAVHVTSSTTGLFELREKSLSDIRIVTRPNSLPSHLQPIARSVNRFDLALIDRQSRGLELSYEEKLRVIDNLSGCPVELDFAGGDPLACYENYLIVKYASEVLGNSAISITSTGAFLTRYGIQEIADIIGQYEFTFDEPPSQKRNRPKSYNHANLNAARKFAELGTKTKAQVPLHSGNIDTQNITEIYTSLEQSGIDEILLMRVFPVGRVEREASNWHLTRDQYLNAIDLYKKMANQYSKPKVRLQCALQYLSADDSIRNPCDAVTSSFGINWKGELLISAWANNSQGDVLDKLFVLGDLAKNSLQDLRSRKEVLQLAARSNENRGHCKIFAFINSERGGLEALFDQADPLFDK